MTTLEENRVPNEDKPVVVVSPEPPLARGLNEVFEAAANTLEHEKVVEAITRWINSKVDKSSADSEFRRRSHYVGTCFSALIFVGIGVMGYLKVIPADGTMGLLGALIGYWYGQRQKQN